ncbi:MAG TPA: FtsX-like permease family protein [Micromonosporaceae bacterium]|jgi:putative ABC transport system permease protein
MSLFASWRTALRVARREVRRARGRSVLVVAMIALPVLALSFAAATYDMINLTGPEKADRTMGTADARIQWQSHWPSMQMPDPADGWTTGYGPGIRAVGGDGPGQADPRDAPGTEAELRSILPAHSTLLPVRRGTTTVQTPDGFGAPDAVMVDASSPLAHGYVDVLDGRAPSTANEVALTEQAMDWLGATIGDSITVDPGGTPHDYTVVGRVVFPSLLDQVLLFAYDGDDAAVGKWFSTRENSWLVDTPQPVTWDQVLAFNDKGIVVTSRAVLTDPPPDAAVPLKQAWQSAYQVDPRGIAISVLVGGLALLEVVLLAGPAFAVSARRRQRQLALVAANGGTPAHIRRIVLADGFVLGVLGAGAGIVLGIAAAFLARPWVEQLLTHARDGGYRVFPGAIAGIAGLAVITGLLAALVPAFITARQNVVSALAGRRGATRSRKRWIAVGLVMIAGGGVITVYGTLRYDTSIMLAGLVIGELGLVFCTPALVGLIARVGRLLPLAPRIALRDAARNRAAAAPAISAVMAAVAGSVTLGMIMVSDRQHNLETWSQQFPTGTVSVFTPTGVDPSTLEQTMRSILPVDQVYPVGSPSCPVGTSQDKNCGIQVVMNDLCPQLKKWMFGQLTDAEREQAGRNPNCDPRDASFGGFLSVDDGSALAALTGASGDDLDRARRMLASGGVVVGSPLYINEGKVTLAIIQPDPNASGDDGTRGDLVVGDDGIYVPPGHTKTLVTMPGYLLTTPNVVRTAVLPPQLVEDAGLAVAQQLLVGSTTRLPSQAEQERFRAAMNALQTGGSIELGPPTNTPPQLLLLIGAAALITLGAAGVGTGLAAADGRADLSTLAAVGASPTVRRGLSVSQSSVIAGLGSVLGSLAGIGVAVAVIEARNQVPWASIWPATPTRPALPWLTLVVVLIAVPLVSILGAGLLTRSRLPIERRL